MLLGRTLLPQLGYPIQRDRKEHLIWEEVRRRLETEDKRVLHIDEMQHITQKPAPKPHTALKPHKAAKPKRGRGGRTAQGSK